MVSKSYIGDVDILVDIGIEFLPDEIHRKASKVGNLTGFSFKEHFDWGVRRYNATFIIRKREEARELNRKLIFIDGIKRCEIKSYKPLKEKG